jgi:DHA2 family multidrug resistance protein-like MFS transporter
VVLAICISVGLTFLVSAGLAFLIEPMAEDLGISDGAVEAVLAVPSIASLTVIFLAGQAGDRLGHRRMMLLFSALFVAGSLVVTGAQETVGAIGGLALCGGSATAIQIVGLGLLQESFPHGDSRVSAFTTFGMVYPLALISFPELTAGLLNVANWRLVPVLWAAAGLVMAGVVGFLVRRGPQSRPMGEWLTLLLAGITLAALVRFLDSIGRRGLMTPGALTALAVLIVATVAFIARFRTLASPSFSFEPVRGRLIRVLLLGVMVISLVGTLTFVIIALEYMYDMSPMKASIAVIPAQAGGVVGAKVLAAKAIRRWGEAKSGEILMLALAVSMLPLVAMTTGTPAWYLVLCAVLFNTAAFAAITVVTADVMSFASPGQSGPMSAIRGAASAIGSGLAVVVLGTSVITSVNVSGGAGEVDAEQIGQLAQGLRIDGILGFAVVVTAWIGLVIEARRYALPERLKSVR